MSGSGQDPTPRRPSELSLQDAEAIQAMNIELKCLVERKKKRKAASAFEALGLFRNLAVVAFDGADTDFFTEGLKALYEDAGGHIIWLSAKGTIQGADNGEMYAKVVKAQIQQRIGDFGDDAAIGFEDYRFLERRRKNDGTPRSQGTPGLRNYVREIMLSPKNPKQPAIVLLGSGSLRNLPGSPTHKAATHDTLGVHNVAHYALDSDNRLGTVNLDVHAANLINRLGPQASRAMPLGECGSADL